MKQKKRRKSTKSMSVNVEPYLGKKTSNHSIHSICTSTSYLPKWMDITKVLNGKK